MRQRNLWRRIPGPQLMQLVTAVSACAIGYEGMSQGVIGAVNVAPEFVYRMGYGDEQGHVTNPTKQGGIVSIYYAGSLLGAFWAGQFADRYGRKSPSPSCDCTLTPLQVSRVFGWHRFGACWESFYKQLPQI